MNTTQQTMSSIIKSLGWERSEHPPSKYYSTISALKNEGYYTSKMYVDQHPHCEPHVLRGFELYEELMQGRNQIDFDDMLWLTLQLLQSNEKCLDYYQNRYPIILVDEFQDTNITQYKYYNCWHIISKPPRAKLTTAYLSSAMQINLYTHGAEQIEKTNTCLIRLLLRKYMNC